MVGALERDPQAAEDSEQENSSRAPNSEQGNPTQALQNEQEQAIHASNDDQKDAAHASESGMEATGSPQNGQVSNPSTRFKDAVGRVFTFPFHLVQTWAGMEGLIKDAFRHVNVLGPQVEKERYDLSDSKGEIILLRSGKM